MAPNPEFLKTIVPLLVPIAAGAVTAVGVKVKEGRLARDRRSLRDQALADASAEVAFASEWWKAHQLLGDDATTEPSRKLLEWLAEAEARVTSTQSLTEKHARPVTLRRLLLLYRMHRRSARILKVVFSINVVWLIIQAIVTVTDSLSRNSSDQHRLGGNITAVATFAVLAPLLRAWAVRSERAGAASGLEPPGGPTIPGGSTDGGGAATPAAATALDAER